MLKRLLIGAISVATVMLAFSAKRIVGADVSLLPDYIEAQAQYKDENGEPINDLLEYLYDEGMRAMRVRLFVDPASFPGEKDPNACQDVSYIIPLCKDIKSKGYDLILDFHYSDTWADPAAQWIPTAWANQTEEELIETIYQYTYDTLVELGENGITPDYIQPGNEISYGMLWSPFGAPLSEQKKTYMGSNANWDRLGNLLNNAIRACHEVCPKAKIIIHTERVAQVDVQNNFYKMMEKLGVEYDIIGISYYPYFHGDLKVLSTSLNALEKGFPGKEIMIVETGYPYAWKVPGGDSDSDYPYGIGLQEQNKFASELVATLKEHESVTGLFWWWLEYNAYGTNLTGWYNAPLFDSRTGKATPALKTLCEFGDESGVEMISPDSGNNGFKVFYNINGLPVKEPQKGELIIIDGKKVIF